MFQHTPHNTQAQTHRHTSGIVIICAVSPRSASVVALRCLFGGDIRNAPHFPSSRFQFVRTWVILWSDGHLAICAIWGSNVEGVSSSFCAMCLERLPCAEWDAPFETTFWSWSNLRLPALHDVVPRGTSRGTKDKNEGVRNMRHDDELPVSIRIRGVEEPTNVSPIARNRSRSPQR